MSQTKAELLEPKADFTISGTTPTLTIGDAGAEDTKIVFDGNAQDFYIGLDDSADDLLIGLGSTVGTTPIISVDENKDVAIPDGGLTITTSDNTDTLSLVSTDADAGVGPNINMYRNSGSVAANDYLGTIAFSGKDDAGNIHDYVIFETQAETVTNGGEDGSLYISSFIDGSSVARLSLDKNEAVFNDSSKALDFRVESDGNANMLTVDGTNNCVGVGAVNTSRTFNVTTPASYSQYVASFVNASSSAPFGLFIQYTGAAPDVGNDNTFITCNDGTARFVVYSDGDVKNHDNSYGQLSDQRIKDEIADANSQWDDIKAVKVRNFKRKDDIRKYGADKAMVQIGLIAQELESVSPNLVDDAVPGPEDVLSSSEFGTLYEDGDTIPDGKEIGDVKEVKENVKGIKYSVLYMKAIKALQEAQTRIETLETKVAALEG